MRFLIALTFICAMGSVSFGAQSPAAHLTFPQNGLDADVYWEQTPNLADEAVLRLEFKNHLTGQPQDPQTDIEVSLFMPEMGHGTPPGDQQKLGTGIYRITSLYFFMGGFWEVRIHMNGANPETQSFRLTL